MYINSVEHVKTYMRRNGYEIVDDDKQYGDVRPYLIVWHRESDSMVYVDLRIYESPPANVRSLWYQNWMHRTLVRNQFRGWLRRHKWRGKRRFDVVMVFPPSGCVGRPVIDHIVDVKYVRR